jgi:hypothetical protein
MAEQFDVDELSRVHETLGRVGSIRAVARILGINRPRATKLVQAARDIFGDVVQKPIVAGEADGRETFKRPLPAKGEVTRYIITSAQSNTRVHSAFFDNLLVFADEIGAEVMVSRFAYNKMAYGKRAVKPGSHPTREDLSDLWFDPMVEPYLFDDRVELAPLLVFCGETNISPTARRPLQGFETYTGVSSAIFPHVTMSLQSIAQLDDTLTKFNYTTGTVTLRNYIQKKAGLVAEHHHCFGALIVEVDCSGRWFVRQLNASKDGSFQDINTVVKDGQLHDEQDVEAITWGDIHVDVLDPLFRPLAWGKGGILDQVRPKRQFMHDTVDFRVRNHHDVKNPHNMFKAFVRQEDSVKDEMQRATDFLDKESYRDWCKTLVVDSNHDNALTRWLREADYRDDPPNAVFFLQTQLNLYKAIMKDPELVEYHVVEDAMRTLGLRDEVRFLRRNESYTIAGGIECSLHGDQGPNGSRGSPISLAKLGRKANTAHTHTAQIIDGMYVAGTSCKLRVSYNDGPSSWSHSFTLTYPNGKRAIVTVYDGKWRC